ncbi:NAD-dependent epimerase/dehydratase family protein [Citrobacter sp. ku-bf4]|uniref:NAD-dependent epimerase/dehydratase family protein n=1 Tax=Citrobacter TaxID=544 RepID=UPI00197CB7AF|nr:MULTISPECIES: NAD-dependent epimerase/dehydratase family protein [Citrobacter]MBN6046140.1 NAD-dependent epimerase/dehydratase family protein [Citrobacter sp. ku-bf4]MBS0827656.1 NAD-dependent epimerase/dehydratase family protein [Citrobacter amalonaticus]
MKILLTGVTGYIGQAVMNHLYNCGHVVHGIVRKTVNSSNTALHYHMLEKNNSNLVEILRDVKPDIVIHIASLFLASHTYEKIEELVKSNITFPTQLLEAMASTHVNCMINTGTSWQHYESEEYNPVNLYAATKQAFDDIVKYYTEAKSFRCLTLKIYDSYGPNDPRGKLISFLDSLASTQEILDMSPGEQEINLVHIYDICRAFEIAIQQIKDAEPGFNQSYGLMSEKSLSLRQLVKFYEEANDCHLNINWGGREYREREVMKPANNLVKLPGWIAEYPLHIGLDKKKRNIQQ